MIKATTTAIEYARVLDGIGYPPVARIDLDFVYRCVEAASRANRRMEQAEGSEDVTVRPGRKVA